MNLVLLSQKEFAHNSCFLCRAWFCWDQLLSQSQPLSVSESQFVLCIIKYVNQTRAASGLPLSSLYWLQGSLLFPRASLGLPRPPWSFSGPPGPFSVPSGSGRLGPGSRDRNNQYRSSNHRHRSYKTKDSSHTNKNHRSNNKTNGGNIEASGLLPSTLPWVLLALSPAPSSGLSPWPPPWLFPGTPSASLGLSL